MKRIKLLIMILILSISLLGCTKTQVHHYQETNINEYLDELYTTINDEKLKYVAVDLRTKDYYEEEHIRQFQNYDLDSGSLDELTTWLKGNYSKKYYVFIFSENPIDQNFLNFLEDHYQWVYIYTGLYELLKAQASTSFILESGPYNCAC